MVNATVHIVGVAPYSTSKFYQTEKLEKETHADYEKRTWRDRCNVNADGNLIIPPMAFKNGIAAVAKRLSVKVPGRANATYTKHFVSGILVVDPLVLPVKKETVDGEWLFVPASGIRGDGKRVLKCFPYVTKWEGKVTFIILDDAITESVFKQHVIEFGRFIGVGRFRPENNGVYGRFDVKSIEWSKQ